MAARNWPLPYRGRSAGANAATAERWRESMRHASGRNLWRRQREERFDAKDDAWAYADLSPEEIRAYLEWQDEDGVDCGTFR